jgi:hypothetical protein
MAAVSPVGSLEARLALIEQSVAGIKKSQEDLKKNVEAQAKSQNESLDLIRETRRSFQEEHEHTQAFMNARNFGLFFSRAREQICNVWNGVETPPERKAWKHISGYCEDIATGLKYFIIGLVIVKTVSYIFPNLRLN